MLLYVDSRYLSPYAMSVFVALHEKAVPFEMVTVELAAGAHRDPGFASLSLTRRVPTLVHGDFALSESSAIAEYLEDAFPGPALYPSDTRTRARARQLQAWLRSDLLAIRQERSTEVVFLRETREPLSAEARDAADKLFAAATSLLAHGGPNLFGAWCIADADLAMMLNRLALHGDNVPPALSSYARRQWELPSVQRWVNMNRGVA